MQLKNIKVYAGKKVILDNINLLIDSGKTTGILGPNGAGKTTLLSLITGLRAAQSGTITLSEENLHLKDSEYRKKIGVVLQENALYDELTVFENLAFSAALYGIPNAHKKISETLKMLGLADKAKEFVSTLSGGLQRRTTVARALLHDPAILIIDEPTLGVDADTRQIIWSHLRLLRSRGATIILSTNHLDEALALCDTVSVLRDGQVLVSGITPQELVSRAGSCMDIICNDAETERLIKAFSKIEMIVRAHKIPEGVCIFIKNDTLPEIVLRKILDIAPIDGFRVRAADLSEIFHFLERRD